MKSPFDMLPTNAWGQHQLQLLATKYLFEKHTGLTVDEAEIWQISTPNHGKSFLCRYPLHPDLHKMGQMLIDEMKDFPRDFKSKNPKKRYKINVR